MSVSERLHLVKGIHLLISLLVPGKSWREDDYGDKQPAQRIPASSQREILREDPPFDDLPYSYLPPDLRKREGSHSQRNPIRNSRWILYLN